MNKRIVISTTGYILLAEAGLMLLPALVALYYRDNSFGFLLLSAGICALFGMILRLFKPVNTAIYAREGFVIVSLSWLLMSAFGALPFYLSGAIPNYIDAFFETVSGFTTTGATILMQVEPLGPGLLFWRSFTHWIGGMGVLVFVLLILPLGGERSIHLMRAEVPGPIAGKLVPRMRNTAKILYFMYFGLTLLETLLLVLGGMSLYDSLIAAFSTAGTGGYLNYSDNIAHFNSPYIEYVIGIFMLLFGVNFNLYYLILIKKAKQVFKNEEFRAYFCIVAISVILITVNIFNTCGSFSESFRLAFFHTASIITTTGFISADYMQWPLFSQVLLLTLMFIGACAGSTGGGMKVSRILLLFRSCRQGISRMLHPNAVTTVHMDKKPVDVSVLRDVSVYLVCYLLIFCASFLALSLDSFSIETSFSSVASCMNNVGPCMGEIGAVGNYSGYNWFSKLVLSMDMFFGRLEIFPLLILFSPSVWNPNYKTWRRR